MPAIIEPAFITLLFKLFTGQATAPASIYMGLGGPGGTAEVATSDGANPPNPTGYQRMAITPSNLTISGSTLTIPTQTWSFLESAGSANSWFLADAQTGGNVFCSGPLGSGPGGNLSAAAGAGSSGITVATSAAATLDPGDTLKLGSTCAGNLEYVSVNSIGTDNGGNTLVSCSVQKSHPSGEAWTLDSKTRLFTSGYVEVVNASVQIVSQP